MLTRAWAWPSSPPQIPTDQDSPPPSQRQWPKPRPTLRPCCLYGRIQSLRESPEHTQSVQISHRARRHIYHRWSASSQATSWLDWPGHWPRGRVARPAQVLLSRLPLLYSTATFLPTRVAAGVSVLADPRACPSAFAGSHHFLNPNADCFCWLRFRWIEPEAGRVKSEENLTFTPGLLQSGNDRRVLR